MRAPYVNVGDKVKLKDSAFEVLPAAINRTEAEQRLGTFEVESIYPIELSDAPGGVAYDLELKGLNYVGILDIDVEKV